MTSHIPEKRQSIMPPRALWFGLAVVAVVMTIVWVALSSSGGQDCPTAKTDQSSVNCT
jgi:hypothetical protein